MKHVLLVEDDTWLADSYRRLLEKEGYQVRCVTEGESAVQSVDETPPDVIVADVLLEGSTIFTLLHELQSYDDTRRIPIVLCSSLGQTVLKDKELRRYGVAAVLDKASLTPRRLTDTLRECVA